jgi:iron complex transport system permease protein
MIEHRRAITTAFLLLILSVGCALLLGRYKIDIVTLTRIIASVLAGEALRESDTPALVLWSVRLPRVIVAVAVGAALSVAGAVFQSLFRNPLVSPNILGVTSGAAFGATLAIFILGGSAWAIEGFAFAWGLIAVILSYQIGKRSGNSVTSLVLSGVIVSSLFMAGVTFLKYHADPYQHLPAMVFWSMGSFNSIIWMDVWKALAIIAPGLAVIYFYRWRLNPLALGDEEAMSLGIEVSRARVLYILLGTLIVAISVSVSGSIGWVGLVVPHMSRIIVGSDHDIMIPFTGVLGGIFMLTMDTLSRSLPGGEIPVGVLTALLGAPFFAYLLISNRRRGAWEN